MYDHERSLVNELKDQPFALVGVNFNDKLEHIQKVVKEKNLNWRSFFTGTDDSKFEDYNIQGFPTIMIIDGDGVVQSVGHKPADDVIKKLLKEM